MDSRRLNLLRDPATIEAAVNAALIVAADPQGFASGERARLMGVLDEIAALTPEDATNRTLLRQCGIALVVSVLMRGTRIARLPDDKVISADEAQRRLSRALEIDAHSEPLPYIVRDMAARLLMHFPVAEPAKQDTEVLEVAVIEKGTTWNKSRDHDFRAYRRLIEPVRLVRAPSAQAVETELNRTLPWMRSATEFVVRELHLSEYAGRRYFRIPPLLLVGQPGVAKTHFAKSLAELVGTPFRAFSAAGSSDSMSLRGTAQGWSSARPSSIITTILQHECASPVVLIDEIEKAASSRHNGNILDTLLTMLDPVTPWFCECLEVSVNLGYCTFIATANSLNGLSRPLLDRFQIVHVPRPGKEYFPALIDSVIARLAKELQLADPRLLPELTHLERQQLASASENVRQLARAVRHTMQAKVVELRTRKPELVH